ncbi:hypothetical protein GCM10010220_60880 [Streptomyces parvulus]|nr:hypothetical protein GCM10010220_60880 [Streptomyces parvulus]
MSAPPRVARAGLVQTGADMGASAGLRARSVLRVPPAAGTSRNYGIRGPQPIRRSTHLTLTLAP